MRNNAQTISVVLESAPCPYCGQETGVDLPEDYRPVYRYCEVCGKKFIAERLQEGFQVLARENAPCYSDPDCRDLELGGYDEE